MKHALYNLLIAGSKAVLWPTRFFSKKMRLFVDGRKIVFAYLHSKIAPIDTTIWVHCASLGEFEQGLPIMEALKKEKPNWKLVVTFFSPSGYEVKKHAPVADAVTYLPFDTQQNAEKFVQMVHPSLAFFVKYEFWPNYLFALKKHQIPTFLVSGLFREKQSFFTSHGGFMRKALNCFDHFFVQNQHSKNLLESIGVHNVTVSGDTRFDRVSHQIEMNNDLDFMEQFKGDSLCLVCGSTWPEDEAVLLPLIDSELGNNIKFVMAPHLIDPHKIASFQKKLNRPTILYSEREHGSLADARVLIIDAIGLLTKVYSYADIAYVGGAMGDTGLHNILEPATFGVPIVIGKNFEKFPEAIKLQDLAGLYAIGNAEECQQVMAKFIRDRKFREQTGMIAGHFVNRNTGATQALMEHLHRNSLI